MEQSNSWNQALLQSREATRVVSSFLENISTENGFLTLPLLEELCTNQPVVSRTADEPPLGLTADHQAASVRLGESLFQCRMSMQGWEMNHLARVAELRGNRQAWGAASDGAAD